ncbi:hypothetical protein C7417_3887 [Cupriavidus plantarum]|nr:hypothetical protein C7417_3887 [Cupriavidus plantarum]
MGTRDDFPPRVTNALRMRAAFTCSNPDCRSVTVAPSAEDDDAFVYTGKAAHITAAAMGGPRYDPTLDPAQRSALNNAIFLCSNCADLIDKNGGKDFPTSTLRQWKTDHEKWVAGNLNKAQQGIGGDGGGGVVLGDRSTIFGGDAGEGGSSGRGGTGGSGIAIGDDALIVGGNGGGAGTTDGRGGRAGRGPTERLGFATGIWGIGRAGAGQNAPEYDRRLLLLIQFRNEYRERFPSDSLFIDAGIDTVPSDWINQRLIEVDETWRVVHGPDGYVMPDLP